MALVFSGVVFGCQKPAPPAGEAKEDWQQVPKPDNYGPPPGVEQSGQRPVEAPGS